MNKTYEKLLTSNLTFEYLDGNCGELNLDSPLKRKWVKRPYDIISAPLTGSMEIHTVDKNFFANEGECIYIPHGQLRRSIITPVDKQFTICFMHFNYSCFGSIDFLSLFTFPYVFKYEQGERMLTLIHDLQKVNYDTGLSTLRKTIKNYELGFALLNIFMENAKIQQSKIDILNRHTRLSELLTNMKEHPEHPYKISKMAKQVGVSDSRLYQLFRDLTSHSPLEYARGLRLKKAMQMLLTTDLSIGEISHELNYPDQFCFSKSFKNVFGISPSTYKKQIMQID